MGLRVCGIAACLLGLACGGSQNGPVGDADAWDVPGGDDADREAIDSGVDESADPDGEDVEPGDDAPGSDGETGDDAASDSDVPAGGPACCGAGDTCPDGLRCERAGFGDPGACVPTPPSGRCWGPSDCGGDEFCAGASPCACGASTCPLPLEPGACTPLSAFACCVADVHCGSGMVCAGATGMTMGFCMPLPPSGRCYTLDDCPTGTSLACNGATSCPCDPEDVSCLPVPGVCMDAPGSPCCAPDGSCSAGRCHHGACLEDPATGCWSDAGCPDGQYCRGERVCPCGTACVEPDLPGTCDGLPSGCCHTVADCGAGQLCLGTSDLVPGRCLDPAGEGECWSDEGCPPDAWPDWCSYCVGVSFCPCVEACPGCPIECPANSVGRCEIDGCI